MSSMSVSEARASLPDVLDRVVAGEEVTITRHGKPIAVVVRPDRLRSRRAAAEETIARSARVGELVAAGRQRKLSARGGLSAERADELAADVRAGRDRR
jgi:prevent-host-death family protein